MKTRDFFIGEGAEQLEEITFGGTQEARLAMGQLDAALGTGHTVIHYGAE